MAATYADVIQQRNYLFQQRVKAFIIDLMIAGVLAIMLRFEFLNFLQANFSQLSSEFWAALHRTFAHYSVIANYTVWVGYLALSYYFTGTSLGKHFMHLKLADNYNPNQPLALWQCFNRALCGPIYIVTVIPGIFPLLNDAGHTIGDWLGQCHVVRTDLAPAPQHLHLVLKEEAAEGANSSQRIA